MKGILPAIIAAVATILVSLVPIYCSNPGKHVGDSRKVFAGVITAVDTGKPISQAEITVVGRNESDVSQGNGNFRVFFHDDKVSTPIKVIIIKDGYKPVHRSFDLPTENVEIKMVPEN